MYTTNYKWVDITDLKVGDHFDTYRIGYDNLHMARFRIDSFENHVVHVTTYNSQKTMIPANAQVQIPLTIEEIHKRDFHYAIEVAKAMEHEIYLESADFHEMWNAWISCDPYAMGAECQEQKITVLGYARLPETMVKKSIFGNELKIGIIAQDASGDTFWCHADEKWFKDWRELYPELYE